MHRSFGALIAILAIVASSFITQPAAAKAPPTPSVSFARFDLSGPGGSGVAYSSGALMLSGGDNGTWTSAPRSVPFAFDELVASWNATTPSGSWITVEMRATGSGRTTKWYTMGIWTSDPIPARRTSVSMQGDANGFIAIDTFIRSKKALPLESYELRLGLHRDAGSASPAVRFLGAMTSADSDYVIPSPRYLNAELEIAVPRYSQEIHVGEFPEYDGGGEAWCSPTSTAMILDKWGYGPTTAETDVFPGPYKDSVNKVPYTDPQVDYAARAVYDWNYQGAGNWPFNTAYAGSRGLNGFVTRLRSLNEAERFIEAGIPLVASVNGHLHQDYLKKTSGHLLTIVGFTETGDVISNDPAAPDNAHVRQIIARNIFENVWLGGSGGIVYVIYPPGHEPPDNVGPTNNW